MAAEVRKVTIGEYAVGAAIVAGVLAALALVIGAYGLPVPQWVMSGLGGALGVIVWFGYLNRRKRDAR